jgi:metal-dependent amidase/aminoacylase/carboxypeptidase family protein
MLGMMGVHALRETFRDQDIVRVHPIITKGGDLVNVVPADVRMETYVRASTMTAIDATYGKVTRALKAGGDAVGAETHINTIPGYLPLTCCTELNDLFGANAAQFMPAEQIIHSGHFGGSTDMGDISHIIPSIQPFTGGICGNLHTKEFKAVDYVAACIIPAKLMAMTAIDLLADQAAKAKEIKTNYKPMLSKAEYLALLDKYFS